MNLDDVARRMAEPMPRRSALRILGAAALGLAFGGARPAASRAQGCRYQACPSRSNPDGLYCCGSPGGSCCYGPSGDAFACCLSDETCNASTGQCESPQCRNGLEPCGPENCCPPGKCCKGKCCGGDFHCQKGQCVRICRSGRQRCGKKCCAKGERCIKGRCRQCDEGRAGCGSKCCGEGRFCCNPAKGICCKRRGGECCLTDPKNAESSGVCCQSPSGCAAQGDLDGASVAGKGRVCCPPKRQGPSNGPCCPPGSTAHASVLVAVGVPRSCCPDDRLCGGRCLARAPGSGVNEQCCGGTPRNVASDPANCGACGNQCPAGQGCFSGTCA